MNVLFIDSTVRPRGVSRTLALADEFMDEYRRANPDAQITTLKLAELDLKPHTWEGLVARDALLAEGKTDDPRFSLAWQFANAERIIIAAPFWDLGFPAYLKLYIENISVCGITFGFGGNRMFGMCHAQKLMYITTRGGLFETQDANMETAIPTLEALCLMFGIGSCSSVVAEGIDLDTADCDAIMSAARKKARLLAATF